MKLKQLIYREESDHLSPGLNSFNEPEEEFDSGPDRDEFAADEPTAKSGKKNGRKNKENPDPHYRLLFAYFKDLNEEKLLTRRDEVVLAAKIKLCEHKAESIARITNSKSRKREPLSGRDRDMLDALLRSFNAKSQKYQDKFIKSNLRLVIELANRYTGRGLPLGDLIQEGNIGLMKAVMKFDHTKGFKFSTYASWWIHQSLSRAVMEQTQVIHIPVYLQELSAKIYRAKAKLELNSDKPVYPREIAEEADLPLDAVTTILKGGDMTVPLELSSGGEDSKTYLDITSDPNAKRAEYYLAMKSITEGVRDSLDVLSERERDIVKMRFGIDYDDDHKLEQIANKYGLSRERIRQIEKEALNKLADSDKGRVLREFLN
ncbi:MAG: sigma-70 family RNA polymerase sigma factor [Deltaproteobacteria bacterium]